MSLECGGESTYFCLPVAFSFHFITSNDVIRAVIISQILYDSTSEVYDQVEVITSAVRSGLV